MPFSSFRPRLSVMLMYIGGYLEAICLCEQALYLTPYVMASF